MGPNIYDVARKAGVSVVTASRVINNNPSVREKNRQKVLAAMHDLNYQPNTAARTLARGRTGNISLVIPKLHDAFIEQMVEAIDSCLNSHDLNLSLTILNTKTAESSLHQRVPARDRADGVILLTPLKEYDLTSELKLRNMPYVLIDNQLHPAPGPTIDVDNYRGSKMAVEHLIKLGHRRIAHISGPRNYLSSINRLNGYQDALKQNKLAWNMVIEGNFSFESGTLAAHKIIEEHLEQERPTAILAGDDLTAIGLMQSLQSLGLSLPEDMSVIGFDDDPLSSLLKPRLTTIRQPASQLATEAVELLLQEIKQASYRNRNIVIKPDLIIRDSVISKI